MGFVRLPGSAGNYMDTPDAAVLEVGANESVSMRFDIAMPDWSPSSDMRVITKWVNTGDHRAYGVQVKSTLIQFLKSSDGTNSGIIVHPGWGHVGTISDGERIQVRVDHDTNSGDVFYYTRSSGDLTDDTGWTEQASEVAWNTTDIFASGTAGLELGSHTNGIAQALEADYYGAVVKIAGTTQFDADMTALSVVSGSDGETFTEDSSNAATVTINGTSWSYVTDSSDLMLLGVG